MNIPRDHLEEAIDQVAQRLTRVDDDGQFASRIIGALPERLTWFGWLTHAWAPRLAMMAIVAGTLAFFSTRHATEVTPSAPPLASAANTNWPQLVASVPSERVVRVTTMAAPRVETIASVEPFEGLPSLSIEEPLTVPALVVDELPLTAESFPERE